MLCLQEKKVTAASHADAITWWKNEHNSVKNTVNLPNLVIVKTCLRM